MRLFTSILASTAMFFVASSASALVTFTATSTAAGPLLPGDLITLNIRVANPGGGNVFGLGGAVFGYDASVVEFVSGNSVATLLHDICIPAAGCFNGLDNQAAGALENGTPSALSGANVQIVNSASTTARTGLAANDSPGLNGVVAGGDAQFRVTFRAIGEGATTFNIGTNLIDPVLGNAVISDGGAASEADNDSIAITVVPEPGTALLMGLGLAGLAAAGRRE